MNLQNREINDYTCAFTDCDITHIYFVCMILTVTTYRFHYIKYDCKFSHESTAQQVLNTLTLSQSF